MDQYPLQMLQWKQMSGFVLTKEEELLLQELTSKTNNLFDDWLDTNY